MENNKLPEAAIKELVALLMDLAQNIPEVKPFKPQLILTATKQLTRENEKGILIMDLVAFNAEWEKFKGKYLTDL